MKRIAIVLAAAVVVFGGAAVAQSRGWPQRPPPPRGGYLRAPPRAPVMRVARPGRGYYLPPPSPAPFAAGWRQQQSEARWGVRRGAMAPLGRVIEGIGRRTPGRMLDAGTEFQGGRAVYRVRWLTAHGRRIDYIVDAATGAILRGG